jgi:dihydrofolate reductase
MISIIAAIGKNNELGKKNALLWNLPADMKRFRETTKGHTVVMGEKTFRSIGKPLPNRRNIVLTQDKTLKIEGVETVYSTEELDELLNKNQQKNEEIFIIGGGMIYKLFIEKADKLYITHVDASFPDADTFFPEIIPIVWNEIIHKEYKKDSENHFDYTFSEYERF